MEAGLQCSWWFDYEMLLDGSGRCQNVPSFTSRAPLAPAPVELRTKSASAFTLFDTGQIQLSDSHRLIIEGRALKDTMRLVHPAYDGNPRRVHIDAISLP